MGIDFFQVFWSAKTNLVAHLDQSVQALTNPPSFCVQDGEDSFCLCRTALMRRLWPAFLRLPESKFFITDFSRLIAPHT